MRCSRRLTVLGVPLALALMVVHAVAAYAGQRVNKDGDQIAILGFDTVAYFTEGRPVAGTADFEHAWQGATWRFSKAEHRDLFAEDPERYAPRYGGFCAGAMARGFRLTIDPEAWIIVDDKLYLNFSHRGVDLLVANPDKQIAKADENWKTLGKPE